MAGMKFTVYGPVEDTTPAIDCEFDLNEPYGTVTDGGGNWGYPHVGSGNPDWADPSHVNDGDPDTFADLVEYAGGAGTPVYAELVSDLGEAREVAGFVLEASLGCNADHSTVVTWYYSDNGSDWTLADATQQSFDPATGYQVSIWRLDETSSNRYWKMRHTEDEGDFRCGGAIRRWCIVAPGDGGGESPIPGMVLAGELTTAREKMFRKELNGVGAGGFVINRWTASGTRNPELDYIAPGRLVVVEIPDWSDEPYGSFIIESGDFALLDPNEQGGEDAVFANQPGALAYLQNMVFATYAYYEAGDGTHDPPLFGGLPIIRFAGTGTGTKPGQLANRTIHEGQHPNRGVNIWGSRSQPLKHLTRRGPFDYDVDSNGATWLDSDATAEMTSSVGTDLLTTFFQLIGTGVLDVEMGAYLDLGLYNAPWGVDRTSASFAADKVRFVAGVNIRERLVRQQGLGLPYTHMTVIGEGKNYGYALLPDAADRPHREGAASAYGEESTTLDAIADAELARRLLHSEGARFPIKTGSDATTGLYHPTTEADDEAGFWIGDSTTLATGTTAEDYDGIEARVWAITISESDAVVDAEDLDVVVDWRSPLVDLEAAGAELGSIPGAPGGSTPSGSGGGSGAGLGSHVHMATSVSFTGHEGDTVDDALDARPPTHVLASSDPTTGDDDGDGHVVGCRWINESSGEEFVAVDVSTGAAVWESTTVGGGGSLDVEDDDSAVTVSPTTTLQFEADDFAVSDEGGGVAKVTFVGTAAGAITVEEDGDTPITGVDHIVFEATGDASVSVTDDTGGQVTVTIGATGGGGGGAFDPIFASFGAPDVAHEFGSSSLAALTSLSTTPDTADAHTTVPSNLILADNDSEVVGYYDAVTAPFTAICKVNEIYLPNQFAYIGMITGVATPGKFTFHTVCNNGNATFQLLTYTGPTDGGPGTPGYTLLPIVSFVSTELPYYLAVVATSNTSVAYYWSRNGDSWYAMRTGHDNSMTIGSVGLAVAGYGAIARGMFDYMRIWNSALTLPVFR